MTQPKLVSILASLAIFSVLCSASPIIPLDIGSGDMVPDSILGDPPFGVGALGAESDLFATVPPQVVVPSESVLVGSNTDVVPVTNVLPHLFYQPSIALQGPIVQDFTPYGTWYTYDGFPSSSGGGGGGGGGGGDGGGVMDDGIGPVYGGGAYNSLGRLGFLAGSYNTDNLGLGDVVVGAGLFKRQMGGGPPGPPSSGLMGAGPGGAPLGPSIGGILGGGGSRPMGRMGGVGGGGGGGPIVGPTNNFAGTPSGTVTDTLIKPLVSITPHALEPVPVPVSTPYDYPVPVGVPAPVPIPFPVGSSKFGGGCFPGSPGCGGGFGFGGGGFNHGGGHGCGFDNDCDIFDDCDDHDHDNDDW
ncbi:hypothetical protein BG004_000220 [Podila humilis]|nr:hypothetical protein BG004_000220 [Podila humilis]